jgi:hypothetical protein
VGVGITRSDDGYYGAHLLAQCDILRAACSWLPSFGRFVERDGYFGASGESWVSVRVKVSRDIDIAGPDLNWSAKNSVDCGVSRHDTEFMNPTVSSLKNAVEHLGRDDLAVFREWFTSFEAAEWDAQIERDISGGKLDKLAAEGIEEFVAGRTRSL